MNISGNTIIKVLVVTIIIVVFVATIVFFYKRLAQKRTYNPKSTSTNPTNNEVAPGQDENFVIFTHPILSYSLKYPKDWSGGLQTVPSAMHIEYQDFAIKSPDYVLDEPEEGYATIKSGAQIAIFAKTTTEESVEKLFKEDTLAAEIATNKLELIVSGVDAIQYDFSYEAVNATTTIFVKDGIYYFLKFSYPSQGKSKYLKQYLDLVNSFNNTKDKQ